MLALATSAQVGPVLNELMASNRGAHRTLIGCTPDWVEVLNPTNKEVDLLGWRVTMAGKQHVFAHNLFIPPLSRIVLWCDGRTQEGDEHLAFKLDRKGGAVMLIAPDGVTIHDVLTYPAMPDNVSIGRLPDGKDGWSFFTVPTPGEVNRSDQGLVRSRCRGPLATVAPGFHQGPMRIELVSEPGCHVRYTLDGMDPGCDAALDHEGPIALDASTALRAVAVGDHLLPSTEFTGTYVIGGNIREAIALTMDPEDLWNDSIGIYTNGRFNNNTRSGPGWERDGRLQRFGESAIDVRAKLHGSGSRGLRKRSFKVRARHGRPFSFGDGTVTSEAILRADASPHAWLRNTAIETVVRRHALHVEVQPSTSLPLYINAAYWGLYRSMPSKDDDWLRQRAGAEALDVLEGPAAAPVRGSAAQYHRAIELLTQGAPMDSIDEAIDTRSLIDLACIDLWTGRADHDLNVRCFRPKEYGGRWRWVLFDMDLWAPSGENSVERMCSAAVPETPFVPQLLAHAELGPRLLARMTALQASVFAEIPTVADSLHRVHAEALLMDHRRWELELESPHPDSCLALMKRFASERPDHLFEQLARRSGRKVRTLIIEVPPAHEAVVLLDGLKLASGRHIVRCFTGVEVPIEARARDGYEFAGWKGLAFDSSAGVVDLSKTRTIRPLLREMVP